MYIYIYSVLNGGKYFGKNGAQNYKGMIINVVNLYVSYKPDT